MAPKGNKNAVGNDGGRPTLYMPEHCKLAHNYCLLNNDATDKDLARLFGVEESTIYCWKNDHPEFSETIIDGKDAADTRVANALYQRAMGYEHTDVEIKVVSKGSGEGSEIVETPIIKHYPPDTNAARLWLMNRQSGKWRDKVDVNLSGTVNFIDDLDDYPE